MVDLLKQFDANGNLVLNQSATGAVPVTKLKVPGLGDGATTGFLATPGLTSK
jgi:hypothetical protein